MSDTLIDWQLAMVSIFGNLSDVEVSIYGDGTTNSYEALHLPTGTKALVEYPRSMIATAHDQEVQMIKAMDKLKAMLDA